MEERRDRAEALAEVELFLEAPARVDLRDARADQVVAISWLPLLDDRLARMVRLDGHHASDLGQGGLAESLEELALGQARVIRTVIRVSELVMIRPPIMLTIRSAWSITR